MKPEGQAERRGRLYYSAAGELDESIRSSHAHTQLDLQWHEKYLHTSATHALDFNAFKTNALIIKRKSEQIILQLFINFS